MAINSTYDPTNWFFLTSDKTKVFSTKYHKYLSVEDNIYTEWKSQEGNYPTRHPQRNNQDSIAQIYENLHTASFDYSREGLLKQRLDQFAQLKNYDSILHLLVYKDSSNSQWANEANIGLEFQTKSYETLFNLIEENEDITWVEIEEHLPPLSWN